MLPIKIIFKLLVDGWTWAKFWSEGPSSRTNQICSGFASRKICTEIGEKQRRSNKVIYWKNIYFRPVVPNHSSGDHKRSTSSLGVLPQKFEIHKMSCYIMKFGCTYEGFSEHFIVRCSATFKRLGNTVLDSKVTG